MENNEELAKVIYKQISKNENAKSDFSTFFTEKLIEVSQIGEFYYYIFNLQEFKFDFVSPSIKNMLGYEVEEFTTQLFFSILHPDDQAHYFNFENIARKTFEQIPVEHHIHYKIRFDFRLRKKDNTYIRVLHQVIPIEVSPSGGTIRTYGIHTDISHLKKTNKSALNIIGKKGLPSYYNIKITKKLIPTKHFLSARELEILDFYTLGFNRLQISEKLSISKHTVDTHKRKLLEKLNCHNIQEAIRKSLEDNIY